MEELTKAQKTRMAIRIFKTTADALALRGYYKPSGQSGKTLEDALRMISPEIYGTMNDPRIIELKGLEYVTDRLPRGIEHCTRIILTAEDDLRDTSFEKIEPLKRRRTSYLLHEKEICFVVTRGLSEIYDILTHLTFLNIEAGKIFNQMKSESGNLIRQWRELEETVKKDGELSGSELDRALWNLSIILGRTYQETRQSYQYLEKNRKESATNNSLFQIIHGLGTRIAEEKIAKDNELLIYFTPALRDMIGQHRHARVWANAIKEKLFGLGLQDRPLHIISANLHSVMNTMYGYAATQPADPEKNHDNFYEAFHRIREKDAEVKNYAGQHGFYELPDRSGTHLDCQVIDTALLAGIAFHPEFRVNLSVMESEKPVLLVMDYAFGTQAFEVMDELLCPLQTKDGLLKFNVRSVSVMGKAGILPGKKGDIMLATAHVLEGTPHNYIVHNDLKKEDFDSSADVYTGIIVTVLGTSLQNRDVLEKFQTTSWKAVGLEMEGGHYQRAINAAIIRGHISADVKVRYAYYASDNPLLSGQTLASGSMGKEGVRPTYMITKIILEKILN
ncbi:MAG: hypothetical protein BWK80_19505 [Desulfobacteraceae bacterium IS3]|nr:MAG: hypothetical protein BWK80_19505 [Desulfobacteraceae bacterium IS3]